MLELRMDLDLFEQLLFGVGSPRLLGDDDDLTGSGKFLSIVDGSVHSFGVENQLNSVPSDETASSL